MSTQWEQMLKQIKTEYTNHPDSFLRQKRISRAIHPNCDRVANQYFKVLKSDTFFKEDVLPHIHDPRVGKPYISTSYPLCSPLTIQHAYHLLVMTRNLYFFPPKEKINNIVEIGGGYGNFCRIMKRLGYTGKYKIVDFLYMLSIQESYLQQIGINGVEYHQLNIEKLQPEKDDTSLLIATFSINEMPLQTRNYLEMLYSKFNYIVIVHNKQFDGVDNVNYFYELKKRLSKYFIVNHFKDNIYNSAWYMICRKQS